MDTIHQPRLSIGLPVYNGEPYLEQSLDALLGQTFEDFELILSSNASTDGTDDICRNYQARDSRVRFFRQSTNVGCAENDYFVFQQAQGELFKWASDDDLYARDLLTRCVEILDEHPESVLAHSWTAAIDGDGEMIQAMPYPLATDSPRASERLRSMLFDKDGLSGAIRADDFYGVIRSDALRRVKRHGSFYHADQTFMAELALHGPFRQIPEWLYFRRHHPERAHQANPTINGWCAHLDPRRGNRLLHPPARLVGEYVWSYFAAVRRAPLSTSERRECYRHLFQWIGNRVGRRVRGQAADDSTATVEAIDPAVVPMQSVVAGQEKRA